MQSIDPPSARRTAWAARRDSVLPRILASVAIVLTSVIVLQSVATWREVRQAAYATAHSRAASMTDQLHIALETSRTQLLTVMARQVQSPWLRDSLSRLFANTYQIVGIELVSADGHVEAMVGDSAPWRVASRNAIVQNDLRRVAMPMVGSLTATPTGVAYVVVAPVPADRATRQWVIAWRSFEASAVARLASDGYSVFLGDRNGVWTQLDSAPVRGPSGVWLTPVTRAPDTLHAIVVSRSIESSPWHLVVRVARASAASAANSALLRLYSQSTALLVLALACAWWLTKRFTQPLEALTRSVERVADGNYSPPAQLSGRNDEFGRLASAFSLMVSRVDTAFSAQRESERHYRDLFDAVPLPLWVFDRETRRVLAVNHAAIEHYGYSREEFLSLSIDQLRPSEDVPRLRAKLSCLKAGLHGAGRWRHLKRDGSVILVDIVGHDLVYQGRSAQIVVMTDVTEQVRASDDVRRVETRYRRLVHDASVAIVLSTLDGRFLSANPAFLALVGATDFDALKALSAEVFVAEGGRKQLLQRLRMQGSLQDVEVRVRRLSGEFRVTRMRARLVHEEHESEPYIETLLEDITERREVERQLLQAQKMEVVGQLAGGLAHDFNNLLTVIQANTELALSSCRAGDEAREPLDDISRAARSAASLSRQLLVFSRQPLLAPSEHRINDLVSDAQRIVRRAVTEAVTVDLSLDPNAGAIRIDPAQLEQVLVNLAINASDAMPRGGALSITTTCVPAGSRNEAGVPDRNVILTVQDTGLGMDEATLSHIFEPFFTTKPIGRGTGLGLASVYAIVHRAGGTIAATSTIGVGTTFRLTFPCIEPTPTASTPEPTAATARGTEHVLVAEDHPAVRSMIVGALTKQGYSVVGAADGQQALETARESSVPIDLLITDVVMPALGGRELADQINTFSPRTRVLFISGYTEDTLLAQRVQADEAQFLAKPFTGEQVARKVRETLDGKWPTALTAVGH